MVDTVSAVDVDVSAAAAADVLILTELVDCCYVISGHLHGRAGESASLYIALLQTEHASPNGIRCRARLSRHRDRQIRNKSIFQ